MTRLVVNGRWLAQSVLIRKHLTKEPSMPNDILFVGLEVDDKAFHCHLTSQRGSEEFEFNCRPRVDVLCKKLRDFTDRGYELRICYEATYVGFSLQRKLDAAGHLCDVIAPSLVPRENGRRVKTDRIDARKLSRYYKQGLLTKVHVPNEEEESVRDLIRSRAFLVKRVRNVKSHILSICRRNNLHFRQTPDNATAHHWTTVHRQWLSVEVAKLSYPALKFNLESLLMALRQLEAQVESYDCEIVRYSQSPIYEKAVKALCSYRGISTLTAMTLTTEIGDIKRFDHPKRLTSYSGMDISEHSSGENQKKFSITRMGNRHIRTAVVEASQSASKAVKISVDLKKRRKGVDQPFIEIADRCMLRLNKKAMHLIFAGKTKNKVTVACAREMLGFIWESLNKAA